MTNISPKGMSPQQAGNALFSSFPRRRESRNFDGLTKDWMPAFADMTIFCDAIKGMVSAKTYPVFQISTTFRESQTTFWRREQAATRFVSWYFQVQDTLFAGRCKFQKCNTVFCATSVIFSLAVLDEFATTRKQHYFVIPVKTGVNHLL